MRSCAVVLGGHVNGYEIIRDLHENGVRDIILLSYGKQLASLSNKIQKCIYIEKDDDSIAHALEEVHKDYEYIIPFPSDDFQLEALYRRREQIRDFCFLPFNEKNVIEAGDKLVQYEACDKLGVPYPKTKAVHSTDEYEQLKGFMFPLIIKPYKRLDIVSDVFRSLRIEDEAQLDRKKEIIAGYLERGMIFLASEVIPGSTNGTIAAYTAYRNHKGEILNEWIGKKLSQFPDDYGVFSSATNICDPVILEQGRTLVGGMDLYGIIEPEFKYDERDGKYKLMEINLRSMMWHRVGNLSGVNLQYTQWCDATGAEVLRQEQDTEKKIHYAYLKHEVINRIRRKAYRRIYRDNLKGGVENHLAVRDKKDWRPFLFDLRVVVIQSLNSISKNIIRGKINA